MMIDLPVELQQLIYNKLPVWDRVRMKMVLPKPQSKEQSKQQLQWKNPDTERKLGILAGAIQKKRIVKLSDPMKKFIVASVDKEDPTLTEMAQHIPEVAHLLHRPQAARTIEDFIKDNDIEALKDVPASAFKEVMYHNPMIMYTVPPATFQGLMTLQGFREWFSTEFPRIFYFNIYNYGNTALIDYLHQEGQSSHGLDMHAARQYLRGYILQYSSCLMTRRDIRRVLLKELDFDRKDLEHLWEVRMNEMDIDGAQDVDAVLSTL